MKVLGTSLALVDENGESISFPLRSDSAFARCGDSWYHFRIRESDRDNCLLKKHTQPCSTLRRAY